MAERYPAMEDKLYGDMGPVFLEQLKINTKFLSNLENLEKQDYIRKKFPSEETEETDRTKVTTSGGRVVDILEELLTTTQKIATILATRQGIDLPVGFRESAISSSSGVSSDPDRESVSEPVQNIQPHDPPPGLIPMRPVSEYVMDRWGTASQTPRRAAMSRTRQAVESLDMTEVKVNSSSTSSED